MLLEHGHHRTIAKASVTPQLQHSSRRLVVCDEGNITIRFWQESHLWGCCSDIPLLALRLQGDNAAEL